MKNKEVPPKLVEGVRNKVSEMLHDHERVAGNLRRNLSCLGYAQLNNIHCIVEGDELVLTGELDSFYLKQVAQAVALKLPGVRNVINEIVVV